MNYLIAGTGGVGGSIAAFLALNGKDVTCIARGAHLEAIQNNGLTLKSDLKGNHTIPVKACTAEEYTGKADVIFVCVKGYSVDSITDLIKRASHEKTIVIPILNVYGTGPRIQRLVPGVTVLDGCIYIVGFVSAPGEITQMGTIFRLVYGAHRGTNVPAGLLEAVRDDLVESGIKVDLSPDIQRDTICQVVLYLGHGRHPELISMFLWAKCKSRVKYVILSIGLSTESAMLGKKLGIEFSEAPVTYNLKVIDKLDPQSTASMQKDMEKGHQSEIQGLLFDMITAAEEQGIEVPTYQEVAKKFRI